MKNMETTEPHPLLTLATDDGGCLVWPHGCCNGHPAARINGRPQLVRRVVYAAATGQEIPPGMVVHMTCETRKCVNPEHMELLTRQKLAKHLGALGLMSGPVRSAAIARTKRTTHGKLTDGQVAEARTSNATGVELARRFGVSQGHISAVRHGIARRNFSSPWRGLA